eukprot:Selendium_serpulae@DN3550_c0_g1_i2.p1
MIFKNLTWLGLCLASYCAQPLLVDLIKYNGGAPASSFSILIPHYFAMTCIGLYPTETNRSDVNWRIGIALSCLDFVNQLLKKAGLLYAGAAAYIIVDSTTTLWTALWSSILDGKRLSSGQLLGLATISCGLALKAAVMEFSFNNDEFFGVALIMASSILMGLTFVLNELFMKGEKPICGPTLVYMMGTCGSIMVSVWTLFFTIPRFDQVFGQPIRAVDGSVPIILFSYLMLFVAGIMHSGTFWYILSVYGATSSGVLKGLKVAIVFILSHICFCHINSTQCLNRITLMSCLFCGAGVTIYSYAIPPKPAKGEAPRLAVPAAGSRRGSFTYSPQLRAAPDRVSGRLAAPDSKGDMKLGLRRVSTGEVFKLQPQPK